MQTTIHQQNFGNDTLSMINYQPSHRVGLYDHTFKINTQFKKSTAKLDQSFECDKCQKIYKVIFNIFWIADEKTRTSSELYDLLSKLIKIKIKTGFFNSIFAI